MEPIVPFDIAVSDRAGTTVISLVGELDLATAPSLKAVLAEVAQQHPGDVQVDMRGVTFLDSSGISVLVQAHKQLESRGSALRLHGVSESPRRVLEVAGLSQFFRLTD
jgi:anti-sigma B factor antagonist